MASRWALAVFGGIVLLVSCSQGPALSVPKPVTPAPSAASPSAPMTAEAAAIAAGVPPAIARRFIARDSLAKLRAVYVERVMQQIAGHENEAAEHVFKNIQVLKGVSAGQLVRIMDSSYSRAMSWNCTNCHRLAPQGNFASDTSNDKKRARFMQQMTNDINNVELRKLYPKDTPKVTCMTCHRGYNEPPNDRYMLPERGQPGGLPFPLPRPPAGAKPRQ